MKFVPKKTLKTLIYDMYKKTILTTAFNLKRMEYLTNYKSTNDVTKKKTQN